MEGKRATLNNPVYAEILYKIADLKVYPTEFVEEFREYKKGKLSWKDELKEDFQAQGEYRKNIPTLYRQLMKLHEEGFLLIDDEQKKGKKYFKNKKYFLINWGKIAEEFTKKAINKEEEKLKKINDPHGYRNENLKEIKEPEFLEKAKNSKIVQSFFKDLFVHIRQALYSNRREKGYNDHIVLNELFNIILEYDMLRQFNEQFDEAIGILEEEFNFERNLREKYPTGVYHPVKSKEIGLKNEIKQDEEMRNFKESFIKKTIGKEFVEDYFFFKEFCFSLSPFFSDDKNFIVDLVKKDRMAYSVLHYLNFDFASKRTMDSMRDSFK